MTEIAVRNVALGLVVKSFAHLVDENQILPILHIEAGSAHQRKNRALQFPGRVIVFGRERALGAHGRAVFQSLVGKTPQRSADRHRRELAAGVLKSIGLAADLEHRSQARIEHAAKIYIAGTAAGGDNHRFTRAQTHRRLAAVDVAIGAKALQRRR